MVLDTDAERLDLLAVGTPVGTSGPCLALPDRHGRLQRVDTPSRCFKRLIAVGCGHCDHDGALPDLQNTHAVKERDPTKSRPPPTSFLRDSGQPNFGRFDV